MGNAIREGSNCDHDRIRETLTTYLSSRYELDERKYIRERRNGAPSR